MGRAQHKQTAATGFAAVMGSRRGTSAADRYPPRLHGIPEFIEQLRHVPREELNFQSRPSVKDDCGVRAEREIEAAGLKPILDRARADMNETGRLAGLPDEGQRIIDYALIALVGIDTLEDRDLSFLWIFTHNMTGWGLTSPDGKQISYGRNGARLIGSAGNK